jgi:hypothetical protein
MVGNKYNYQRYFDTIEGITKYLNEEIYPKIGKKLVVWRDQEPLPNNPN